MNTISKEALLLMYIAKNIVNPDNFIPEPHLLDNLDWQKFFELSTRHRIYIPVYRLIKEYIPASFQEMYSDYHEYLRKRIAKAIEEVKEIRDFTKKNFVKVIFFKGLVFSKIIYNDLFGRQFDDIDLLVEEDDMIKMDYLVRQHGYFQSYSCDWKNQKFEVLPFPLLRHPTNHEFFEYFRHAEDGVCLKLEIARWFHTVDRRIIHHFFWSTQNITIADYTAETFDFYHTFLCLLMNIFANINGLYEMKFIWRDYVDLSVFFSKYKHEIDWQYLAELAEKYKLGARICCVLKNFYSIDNEEWMIPVINILESVSGREEVPSLEWKSSYENRLLMDLNELRTEFGLLIKRKVFSKFNQTFNLPVKLKALNELDLSDLAEYRDLHNKYELDIKYLVSYNTENLVCSAYIDNHLCDELANYTLEFSFLNNNQALPNLISHVDIFKKAGKLICNYYYLTNSLGVDRKLLQDTCTDIQEQKNGKIITGYVPFQALGFQVDDPGLQLSLRFTLLKKRYADIYHMIDSSADSPFQAQIVMF